MYTECDSGGSRWRVQVPDANKCEGGAPKPPVRGVKCGTSGHSCYVYVCLQFPLNLDQVCDVGEYLDVQNNQDCQKCPPGYFSLGGGDLFEDFTELPPGFTVEYKNSMRDDYQSNKNCSGLDSHLCIEDLV